MAGDSEQWTLATLKEYLDSRLDDLDARYEQRFRDLQVAVNKAEAAHEKRLDSINEFRGQLRDQQATLMPRPEAEKSINANAEKIAALAARMDRNEGRSAMAYPAFEQSMKDIAALSQARSEGSGEKSGRLSQQAAMVMIVGLVVSLIVIGGAVIAIAFAIRK